MPKKTETPLVMGTVSQRREPVWDPLEYMIGSRAREFMWMFEVEMEDGAVGEGCVHWVGGAVGYIIDD